MPPPAVPLPLDAAELQPFTEALDYSMFVVTVAVGEERSGCLVGFTTQASIEPPRFLVCLSLNNHTYAVAQRASLLAVHALGPEQHALARLFGEETGTFVDKFARCSWRPGPHDVPMIEGCPRILVGDVLEQVPFGDHAGFLLEPIHLETTSRAAGLTFRDLGDLSAGHGA
ncbi:MAG TPA: flavin reductase family protein [Segeticoccus sp.]|nr:flavin reductase family protein [Segeticoccus sp.]